MVDRIQDKHSLVMRMDAIRLSLPPVISINIQGPIVETNRSSVIMKIVGKFIQLLIIWKWVFDKSFCRYGTTYESDFMKFLVLITESNNPILWHQRSKKQYVFA